MGGLLSLIGRSKSSKISSPQSVKGGDILLDVPTVAQDKNNTCWYAAACMVAFYFESGPRLGVPPVYKLGDTIGITPTQFATLARNEGLTNGPLLTYHTGSQFIYPATILRQMLRDVGPIWCAGYWYGVGHIIVLTGIVGENVCFNDPDGGVRKTDTVTWFNDKIARNVNGHMLCRA